MKNESVLSAVRSLSISAALDIRNQPQQEKDRQSNGSYKITNHRASISAYNTRLVAGRDVSNAGALKMSGNIEITANSGGISGLGAIKSQGYVRLKSKESINRSHDISARSDIRLTSSAGSITNKGRLRSSGSSVSLWAYRSITNSNAVTAARDVNLTARYGSIANNHYVHANRNANIWARHNVTNLSTVAYGHAKVTAYAGTLTNRYRIYGYNTLTATAGKDLVNQGYASRHSYLFGRYGVSLSAGASVKNMGARIWSYRDINIAAGTKTAGSIINTGIETRKSSSRIQLSRYRKISKRWGVESFKVVSTSAWRGSSINSYGGGKLNLTAYRGNVDNTGSVLDADKGALSIYAAGRITTSGKSYHDKTTTTVRYWKRGRNYDRNSVTYGRKYASSAINAGTDLSLNAGSDLTVSGGIKFGRNIALASRSGVLTLATAINASNGYAALSGGRGINVYKDISARSDIRLTSSAGSITNKGRLRSSGSSVSLWAYRSITNLNAVTAARDVNLTARYGSIANNHYVHANRNANIWARHNVTNLSTVAYGHAKVTAYAGTLTNRYRIYGYNTLTATAGKDLVNQGYASRHSYLFGRYGVSLSAGASVKNMGARIWSYRDINIAAGTKTAGSIINTGIETRKSSSRIQLSRYRKISKRWGVESFKVVSTSAWRGSSINSYGGGKLNLTAYRGNVDNTGSVLDADKGALSIYAAGRITTSGKSYHDKTTTTVRYWKRGRNYDRNSVTYGRKYASSAINAGTDLSLNAGSDLTVSGGIKFGRNIALASRSGVLTLATAINASNGYAALSGGRGINVYKDISARSDIRLTSSAGSITNKGRLRSSGSSVSLWAYRSITNSNAVTAARDVNLTARYGSIANNHYVHANRNANIWARHNVTNLSTVAYGHAKVTAYAGTLTNRYRIYGYNTLTATAGKDLVNQGYASRHSYLFGRYGVSLSAGASVKNMGARIWSYRDINIAAGTKTAGSIINTGIETRKSSSRIQLSRYRKISKRWGVESFKVVSTSAWRGSSINSYGGGKLNLTAYRGNVDNTGSVLDADKGALSIYAAGRITTSGKSYHDKTTTTVRYWKRGRNYDRNSVTYGRKYASSAINAGTDLSLNAGSDLTVSGGIKFGRNIALASRSGVLTLATAINASNGYAALSGGRGINVYKDISARSDIRLTSSAGSITNKGRLRSSGSSVSLWAYRSITNSNAVTAARDVNLTARYGSIANNHYVHANRNANIWARHNVTNLSTVAYGHAKVTAYAGTLTNRYRIYGYNTLTATAGKDLVNQGYASRHSYLFGRYGVSLSAGASVKNMGARIWSYRDINIAAGTKTTGSIISSKVGKRGLIQTHGQGNIALVSQRGGGGLNLANTDVISADNLALIANQSSGSANASGTSLVADNLLVMGKNAHLTSGKGVTVRDSAVFDVKSQLTLAGGTLSAAKLDFKRTSHIILGLSNLNITSSSDINLTVHNHLTNTGVLSARNVNIVSNWGKITNNGTINASVDVSLESKRNRIWKNGVAYDLKAGDWTGIDNNGRIQAGRDISLRAEGRIETNTLSSRRNLTITSLVDDVTTTGNLTASNILSLTAGQDIKNNGGTYSAGTMLSAFAGRDIVNEGKKNYFTLTSAHSCLGKACGKQGFTYSPARIISKGGLTLNAGRDIKNLGGEISGEEFVNLTAERDIINQALYGKYAYKDYYRTWTKKKWWGKRTTYVDRRYHEKAALQTSIIRSGNGSVKLDAGRDIYNIGALVQAKDKVQLAADENIIMRSISVELKNDYFYSKKSSWLGLFSLGKGSQNTKWNQFAKIRSVIDGGNVEIHAGDNIYAQGASIVSKSGVELLAGDNVIIEPNRERKYHSVDNKSSGLFGWFRDDYRHVTESNTIDPSKLDAKDDLTLVSATGDIDISGSRLTAGRDVTLSALNGRIRFGAEITSEYEETETYTDNGVWFKSQQKGSYVESVIHNQITAGGTIRFRAKNGIIIEYRDDGNIENAIDTFAKAEGLQWMADLTGDNRVQWNAVKAASRDWNYEAEGLTAPAAALIAIALTAATGGTIGALAAGITNNVVLQAALQAGMQSLVNRAAISFINNKGDLGAVLKELGSDEALKSLAVSMITAGVTAGLDATLFKDLVGAGGNGFDPALLGRQLARDVAYSAVRAGVSTAIQGGDFGDKFVSNLRYAAASTIGKQVAEDIGKAYVEAKGGNSPTAQQYLFHKIAHTALGCALGSIANGNCVAGGAGALVGAVVSEGYQALTYDEFKDGIESLGEGSLSDVQIDAMFENWRNRGINLAKLSGALAAAAAGGDADLGAFTAGNVAENNFLPLVVLFVKGALLAYTAYEVATAVSAAVDNINGWVAGSVSDAEMVAHLKNLGINIVIDVSIGKLKILEKVYNAISSSKIASKLGDFKGAIGDRIAQLRRGVCSFHGETQVLTSNGYTAIQNMSVGNLVWSRNDQTGQMGWKSVLAHYSNPYKETVSVTMRDMETGQEQTIVSNKIHPFFVQVPQSGSLLHLAATGTDSPVPPSSEGHNYQGPIANGHWVDASNLKAGYRLLNDDESWAEVVSVKVERKELKAYNLTVAGFHTYFVRGADNDNAQPVWVHNNCFNRQTGTFDNPPGHMRPGEIESGRRLQDELGIDVRPMDAQNGPDFVDVNGKTYDAMGVPNAYSNWGDGSGFLKSIDDHLVKSVDNVVIDLAGSSSRQRQQILDHLASSSSSNVNSVIFVGN